MKKGEKVGKNRGKFNKGLSRKGEEGVNSRVASRASRRRTCYVG